MALKVGELYASFNVDTSGVTSALSKIETSFTNIGSQLTSIGNSLTENLTRPLMKFADSIWTSGSSFSQQMADVKAIAELTEEEYQMLKELAIEQGSTTVYTATQAGEALEYMAMAGWNAEEMYAGLPGVLSLAAASGEDLGAVSDIVTDAMTAFRMAANESGRFSDVLAVVSAQTNTDVGLMGYTFKYVAPLAGALGYTIEDVAVAIGIMSNSGIKGAQAGVTLRRLLSNLANPTDMVAGSMERLGISLTDAEKNVKPFSELLNDFYVAFNGLDSTEVEEFFSTFEDLPAEELEDFEEYVNAAVAYRDEFARTYAGLSEDQKIRESSAIAGVYAMPGLLALMNTTWSEVEKLTAAVQNAEGDAAKMAATRLDSAAGDVTILQSAVEGLQITLFDLVEEDIRSVIQAVTELVQGFQSLDNETQVTILQAAGVAAALGPVTTVVGTLTTGVTKLVPALGLMAGPVGLILTSLALLGTAAVDADNNIGEGFESLAGTVADTLDSVDLDSAFQTISERMPALTESLRNGIDTLLPALATFIPDTITTLSGGITDNMDGILNLGLDILGGVAEGIANSLPKLADSAGDIISSLIQYVLTTDNWTRILELGWAIVKGVAEGIYHLGKDVLVDAWKVFDQSAEIANGEAQINLGEEIFTADANTILRNGIRTVEDFYTIADAWTNAANQIDKASYIDFAWLDSLEAFNAVYSVFDPAASVAQRQNAWSALEADAAMLEVILPSFERLPEVAAASFEAAQIFEESAELMSAAPIADNVVESVETVTEALAEMTETEALVAQTLPEITAQLGVNSMEGVASGIDNGATTVEISMNELAEDVVTAAMTSMSYESGYSIGWEYTRGISESIAAGAVSVLHSAESVLNYNIARNIGVLFAKGIARGIRSGVASITAAAEYVAQQAVSATKNELDIHSPSRVAEKQVGWMWDEGLATGLLNHVDTVTRAARQVSSALSDSFYVSDPGRGTVGSARSTVQDIMRETNEHVMNGRTNGSSSVIDYDRLADALRRHPTVMEMDGRIFARLQTKETAMAANMHAKSVAMGYGKR